MEIIAEIGQNHNGDMKLAEELIYAAKENGADVAKFQVYDVNKIFTKKNNPWYDYNCKTELSKENVFYLDELCKKLNIEFMASVFDVERIKWLEEINIKRYKIASRSIFDNLLMENLISTGKPLIISLGFWKNDQFPIIPSKNTVDFLYCISNYPTKLEEIEFTKIDFNRYSGFSDHTEGLVASIVALSRGAKIIEKHFTLDKKMYGPDHIGSMNPQELKNLVKYKSEINKCL